MECVDEMDLTKWIAGLFEMPAMLRMGHNQRAEDLNLGLGWLYYSLGRIVRPRNAVVIGSYRGFVPAVIGRALDDNTEKGLVTFIDPSLVDEFWKDAAAVGRHFAQLGLTNIRHYLMTTQQFVASPAYRELERPGLVFIDGYHSLEQARYDYESFIELLAPRGIVLLHDSMTVRQSPIYGQGRHYEMRVRHFVDQLKTDPTVQVFDIPFGTGVTLVRKLDAQSASPLNDGIENRPR